MFKIIAVCTLLNKGLCFKDKDSKGHRPSCVFIRRSFFSTYQKLLLDLCGDDSVARRALLGDIKILLSITYTVLYLCVHSYTETLSTHFICHVHII